MFPISQDSLADIGVQNQVLPRGGPKCVPVPLAFVTQTGFILDLQNMQALNRFSNLQTLYIDNSGNSQILIVTVGRGGQQIKAPAGSQGYYPILASNPLNLNFSVAATSPTDTAYVFLLNVPLPSSQWVGNPAFSSAITVTIGTVTASTRQVGSGDVSLPLILTNHPIVATGVQASDFAAAITPTAGKKYLLAGFTLSFTPDTALSNGAAFAVLTLTDSTAGIIYEQALGINSAPFVSPVCFSFLSAVNATLGVTILDSIGGGAITLGAGKLIANFSTAFGLFT
jgi:hypothetical protein